ncbi:MAG: hypothetical protein UZ17_ACD001002403 [Acidobacteria bacterium OLB17]|nr:MAG: hypothetical protein UZ17_ACD001002403 [Acidobacteria bacterium OLB17]
MKLLRVCACIVSFGCCLACSSEHREPAFDLNAGSSKAVNVPIPDAAPSPEPVAKAWAEVIGEYKFRWDGKDLMIMSGSDRSLELFRTDAETRVRWEQRHNDAKGCSFDSFYRPLAVAGPLVSFENESSTLCGGAITNTWGYRTVKLVSRHEGKPTYEALALSDIFSDADILDACMGEQRIKDAVLALIEAGKIANVPKSFAELKRIMANFRSDFFGGRYFLPEDLDSFALRSVDGEHITIWIGLLPIAPPERALRHHIELILPLREKYRGALLAADAKKVRILNEGCGFASW